MGKKAVRKNLVDARPSTVELLHEIIDELISALELCLSCEGSLSWEAEQEAEATCRKARKHRELVTQPVQRGGASLSPRETEILTLTACGKTRNDVSKILSISEETVKDYFDKILRKLNANNKTHAVSIAAALGSISLCLDDLLKLPEETPQMGSNGNEESTRKGDAAKKI